uniref:Uncharacterized protein n=1 Tax=Arundo donax TaxID=35708 RepID=A0A0A9FX99_ARUDO
MDAAAQKPDEVHMLQLGDEHDLVLELVQALRRVLRQPFHRHRLPSFQFPLVDRAKAAFSKLGPCRKIVSGQSYCAHVKERDIQVLVLTGFVFHAPVLDRSKSVTGVK